MRCGIVEIVMSRVQHIFVSLSLSLQLETNPVRRNLMIVKPRDRHRDAILIVVIGNRRKIDVASLLLSWGRQEWPQRDARPQSQSSWENQLMTRARPRARAGPLADEGERGARGMVARNSLTIKCTINCGTRAANIPSAVFKIHSREGKKNIYI